MEFIVVPLAIGNMLCLAQRCIRSPPEFIMRRKTMPRQLSERQETLEKLLLLGTRMSNVLFNLDQSKRNKSKVDIQDWPLEDWEHWDLNYTKYRELSKRK